MKYLSVFLLVLVLPLQEFKAQEKLNAVQQPTSPAASVLGLQPGIVLMPKTYQALETAVYSNFSNSGNIILPQDFAIEFSPYWAADHGLSLQEYLFPKSFWDQIKRSSSFSVSTTKNFALGDGSLTSGLGLGYRASYHISNEQDRNKVDEYYNDLRSGARIRATIGSIAEGLFLNDKVTDFNNFWELIEPDIVGIVFDELDIPEREIETFVKEVKLEAAALDNFDIENYEGFLDHFYKIIDDKLDGEKVFKHFENYIRNRYGLYVDVAYAILINFPSNRFEYSIVPRHSFWLTPTYNFKEDLSFLNISGVLRLEWYDNEYYRRFFDGQEYFANNLDYGLAISAHFKRFATQIELVGRSGNSEIFSGTDPQGNDIFSKVSSSDFQYIASFEYNITDQIVLSYSLGSQFESVNNFQETLISLLALNFGFGTPTKDDLVLIKEENGEAN